jgi:hypothetical protein
MAWMGCRTLLADAGCADAFRVRRNAGTTIARASLAREAGADPQAADFHAKRHFARQGAALSLSRESGSEDSLAGVPTGLPNTRAVVARDESGRRCDPSETHGSGFKPKRGGAITSSYRAEPGVLLCMESGGLNSREVRSAVARRGGLDPRGELAGEVPAVGRNGGWPDEPRKFDGQASAQPVSFRGTDGGCCR